MNKSLLIALGVVLVVGALFYFASSKNDDLSLSQRDAEENSTTIGENGTDGTLTGTVESASPGASSVVLQETSPGSSVTVQSATLAKPGYIVLYRAQPSGTTGTTEIVGRSGLLPAGSYSNQIITLSKSIAVDQSVSAVLHADDGDGEYEVPGADGYLGSGNLRIVSDVDVVGAPAPQESPLLKTQVESYLEQNYDIATTTP